MAKPKTFGPYTRLLPVRRHLGGYSSLWLAKDHVLSVNSTGYSDKYNRFYLRDIQGFMLEDSERRFYIGILLGIFGAAFVLISLLNQADWYLIVIWLVIFGGPLIWNHVKGPGCKLYLVTQVQTTRVMAVARRARAEELILGLSPLIESAQADLPRPEGMRAAKAEVASTGLAEQAVVEAPEKSVDAG